jgi:periplasmic copper chaperone A
MNRPPRVLVPVLAAAAALAFASSAFAHARISPAVSLANKLQLYSLAVPTEEANATTTKIVLTLPKNFSIDSFVPSPGWKRAEQQTGSGEDAVITQVTWTGGHVPTEEDSLFQFLAQPAKSGTYTFQVQQTYSSGKIVNWSDPETGQDPAPAIDVVSSVGGGTSTLSIVALVLGAVGILVGAVALASRGGGGRQLA